MQHKKLLILVFVLVALVQIYVPAKMVYDSEVVLNEGTAYKFRTAPVDPTDPFRGKYVTLRYDIDDFQVDSDAVWSGDVFVLLTTDSAGYAKILGISKFRPDRGVDFVVVTDWYRSYDKKLLHFKYSFNRFYMEESKAYDAERAYQKASRNRDSETYALVHVKNGVPIVKDVLIDGVPIRELVIANNLRAEASENI